MIAGTIPIKTPVGQAELTARERSVSQRHRTVLFLVDGRRSAPDVRRMAEQAGAPDTCFDDLVELGMIALPPPLPSPPPPRRAPHQRVAATASFDALEHAGLDVLHIDLPLFEPAAPSSGFAAAPSSGFGSILPPARSLFPDDSTTNAALGADGDAWRSADTQAPSTFDTCFDAARLLLVRAVRAEAPIAGSLTLLRLRRAKTRAELFGLLGEVEARISKPQRLLAVSQTMRRARELLEGRIDASLDLG